MSLDADESGYGKRNNSVMSIRAATAYLQNGGKIGQPIAKLVGEVRAVRGKVKIVNRGKHAIQYDYAYGADKRSLKIGAKVSFITVNHVLHLIPEVAEKPHILEMQQGRRPSVSLACLTSFTTSSSHRRSRMYASEMIYISERYIHNHDEFMRFLKQPQNHYTIEKIMEYVSAMLMNHVSQETIKKNQFTIRTAFKLADVYVSCLNSKTSLIESQNQANVAIQRWANQVIKITKLWR